jgi:hypothetical protein
MVLQHQDIVNLKGMDPYKEKQKQNPSNKYEILLEVLRGKQEGIELELKSLQKKLKSKIC